MDTPHVLSDLRSINFEYGLRSLGYEYLPLNSLEMFDICYIAETVNESEFMFHNGWTLFLFDQNEYRFTIGDKDTTEGKTFRPEDYGQTWAVVKAKKVGPLFFCTTDGGLQPNPEHRTKKHFRPDSRNKLHE